MKTPLSQSLRRPSVLAVSLAVCVLAVSLLWVTSGEARHHREAAERVAAAHVNLMSALTAAPMAPVEAPADNAAVAVLRAAAVSTSSLALAPESE